MKSLVKNILVIILVLALMAGSIYEYFRLKKVEVPISKAITAIPLDASFILECRKAMPLWKSISQTSLIWQDLVGTESVGELNRNIVFLDSLLVGNNKVRSILESPLFISAHKNGMDRFDYLFISSVPDAGIQAELLAFVAKQGPVSTSEYDGTSIYTLKRTNKDELTYSISPAGIFICSFEPNLVKESLRQLESHISLLNNKYFTKVLATSSDQVIANLFINFQSLNTVANSFMGNTIHSAVASLQDFAQWMELDLTFEPNEIVMNGFTDCDTTGSQFMDLMAPQLPQQIRVGTVVPSNTALMSCMELSSYNIFSKQYKKYMDIHRKLYKHNEWIEGIKKTYGFSPEKYFNWVENEMALVITEPTDSTLHNDVYAVIGSGDIKHTKVVLDSLSDSVAGVNGAQEDSSQFMHHEIRYIGIENLLANVLGGTFEMVKKTYYTTIKDYVVFANSKEALQMFINHYESGNTLDKDTYYQSFVKEHVEDESGLYIYNNMALSPMLYGSMLDKPYPAAIKKHTDICRKFQALSIQMSYMQGMFYTSIYLKRNPQFKKQAGALWQVVLDTAVATTPCWVTDHKTQNKFVFVQDKANTVYLISNTGKIEWKREVDGRIMSDVSEVDVMKNDKVQYLFNTADRIYILDRNGKNVSGFPVELPSNASGPITLFDYDGDKKYRILVPCEDKVIREYDVKGKKVEGWEKPETYGLVTSTVKHVMIEDKDYDVVVDNLGKVYLYDRKGNERPALKKQLPKNISTFYVQGGKDFASTYILTADSNGVVNSLNFVDELTQTHYLAGNNPHAQFTPVDLNDDKKTEMIFLGSGEIFTYNTNKSLVFHCTGKDSLSHLQIFTMPNNKVSMGAVDNKNNKIYLWDNLGALSNNFPLYGSLGFNIADMNNDGQLYLVAGSKDNNVYVYSLQ